MTITYRDEIGIVTETVDKYGIYFLKEKEDSYLAYFNDKCVSVEAIMEIMP